MYNVCFNLRYGLDDDNNDVDHAIFEHRCEIPFLPFVGCYFYVLDSKLEVENVAYHVAKGLFHLDVGQYKASDIVDMNWCIDYRVAEGWTLLYRYHEDEKTDVGE